MLNLDGVISCQHNQRLFVVGETLPVFHFTFYRVVTAELLENANGSLRKYSVGKVETSQQRVEHLSEYESLAYALRLLCSPFLQSGCDYPNIEDGLLEKTRKDNKNDVLNWRTKSEIKDPPHMPYVVIHARAKRSKTSGNKS